MPTLPLLLGIDGGGTTTVCHLTSPDGFDPLGVGRSGPSNPKAIGWDAALRNVDDAIDSAFQSAGLPRVKAAVACLGLAGVDRETGRRQVAGWAADCLLADGIITTTDIRLLHAAGIASGSGIALICGTGSIAYGEHADGRSARTGGWGNLMGDEGSGYYFGSEALKAVARSVDGRLPPTALAQPILREFAVSEPWLLIDAVYAPEVTRERIASLAISVLKVAEAGDPAALDIVERAAAELADMIAVLARRLNFSATFPLTCGGSILVHSELLREQVLASLTADYALHPSPTTVVNAPVEGAIALARRALTDGSA